MKHPRSSNLRRRHRPFTLVEMLAVIAIMMILFGIAVAPFGKLLGGSGVDGAARMIGAQLRLARQYALSQRKYVAVLMPAENGAPAMRGVAFRTCVVDGNDANFVEWVPDTKWEQLPAQSIIYFAGPDTGNDGDVTVSFTQEPYTDLDDNGQYDGGEPYFDVNGNGNHNTSLSSANEIRAVVFKPTGKIKTSGSYYTVRVVEGVNVDGALSERNSDNAKLLKLDVFTGRVTYEEP